MAQFHLNGPDASIPEFEVVRIRGGGAPAVETLSLLAFFDIPAMDVGFGDEVTLAEARNVAVIETTAEWLVFIDGSATPQLPWIGLLWADLRDASGAGDVAVSIGRASGSRGYDIAYRRDLLEAVGGFDEAATPGAEDFDLQLRLVAGGYRVVEGSRQLDRSCTAP
jgi:hypothetical protein